MERVMDWLGRRMFHSAASLEIVATEFVPRLDLTGVFDQDYKIFQDQSR